MLPGWTTKKSEGLEMPRSSLVEMETASLERSGERQMVWPTPTTVQNLQVGGHGCRGSFQICWKRRRSVEKLSRTTRVGSILLKTVEAGNSFRNVERDLKRSPRAPRGPMCVRHDWDGCRCYLVVIERRIVRERFSVHLVPLSLYQANSVIALMS